MERVELWSDLLISSYLLNHISSAILIICVLYLARDYFQRRPSFTIDRFVYLFAVLLFLLAINQVRNLLADWYLHIFFYIILDLSVFGISMYLLVELFIFRELALDYPSPARIERMKEVTSDAVFNSQQHIQSRWVSHLDEDNTAKFITRELSIPNNEENIGEIKHRLSTLAEIGEGEQSEFYDLNLTLEAAKNELAEAIADRDLEILNEHLPTVHCYPAQMQMLFEEMIRNVIKHNKDECPRLIVFEEEQENDWMIIFEDNGEGMYLRHQKQFFYLFKLDDEGALDKTKGMGLALCRKIMRNHRGHIWMESDYYSGVSLYITIPKYLALNPRDIPEYTYPD